MRLTAFHLGGAQESRAGDEEIGREKAMKQFLGDKVLELGFSEFKS